MNASDIKDEETLNFWLNSRPSTDSIVISQRAALRVAPIWFAAMATDWADDKEFSDLAQLRLLITAATAGTYQTQETKTAARALLSHAMSIRGFSARITDPIEIPELALGETDIEPALAARASAGHALSVAFDYPHSILALVSHAVFAARAAGRYMGREVWASVMTDCATLEAGQTLDGVPLWDDTPNPFQIELKQTRTRWSTPNSSYAFWLRWYEAALEGNSLNPELERDIALIPDADWEKGAEHIAALIADLEERHDLKAQVQALRQQLTLAQTAAADAAHRGHNQPPELIDSAPEVQREITIIFDTLDDAEEELSKTNPSPTRLKVIGQALLNAGMALAKYCGGLGDTALQKAAEELGTSGTKWAIRIGAASWAAQAQPVQSLGRVILEYALKLAQGG